MTIPMIPVSSALGGGLMPCFKRQPAPGACTTVNCSEKATRRCGYELANGKLCGRPVCEKHGAGNICMSHQRALGLRVR